MHPTDPTQPPVPGAPILKKRPLTTEHPVEHGGESAAPGTIAQGHATLGTIQPHADGMPGAVDEAHHLQAVDAQGTDQDVPQDPTGSEQVESQEGNQEAFSFPTARDVFGGTDEAEEEPHNQAPIHSITPAPTQAPVHIQASEAALHIRDAQTRLDSVAEQIKMGEYGSNGAGDAGRIWRAIRASSPEQSLDIWSELIALGTGLWNANHHDESIALISRSAADFGVPVELEQRVEDSLKSARDLRAALAAEAAFEAGKDEEAMERASEISEQAEGEQYRQSLQQRTKRRAKQRRIIFASAGVAIAGLLVASGIAITTMDRINVTPPTPDFSGVTNALETVSEDLRDQRTLRDQALASVGLEAPQAPAPQAPIAPAQETTAPADTPAAPTNTAPTSPSPQAPVAPTTPAPVAPTAAPAGQTPPAAEDPATSTQAPAAAAQTSDTDLVSSCVLGYAVMNHAQALSAGQGAEVAARLAEFAGAVDVACTPLNIPNIDIVRGMGQIDPATIDNMAKNILAGQQ